MFRWVEHTSELEVRIEAPTERAVCEDALAALADALGQPGEDGGGTVEREVTAAGPDRPALLAAWMEELVFLAESEGLVPVRAVDLALEDDRLRARVEARPGDPPHLIKAVTYHRLEFEPDGDAWRAAVVLDV
jgi:SHS2 domain-containing protein